MRALSFQCFSDSPKARNPAEARAFALTPHRLRIKLFTCAYFFFRFRWGTHAKLLHQSHHIPIRPVFDDLAAVYAGDGSARHVACAVGRLQSKERSFVGTMRRPVHDNLIALADHVLDREAEVGETSTARSNML